MQVFFQQLGNLSIYSAAVSEEPAIARAQVHGEMTG